MACFLHWFFKAKSAIVGEGLQGLLSKIGLSDCLPGYVSAQALYFAKSSSGHGSFTGLKI